MFECETCDRTFGTHGGSVQHMNALDHWAPTFECDFCTDEFYSQEACDDHMDRYDHHRWNCETCSRDFPSPRAAEQHVDAVGHWEHYCAPCQRKFQNANNLRMHLHSRVHQGTNIACPFCKRAFTNATGVTSHLESGSCPNTQGVDRETIYKELRQRDPNGLVTNNLLEWHQETWSTKNAWDGSGYHCYLCHREFATHYRLNQHLDSPAHKQQIYHCPNKLHCALQFKTLASMFNHLESESCGYIKFDNVQKNVGNFLTGQHKTIGFY